MSSIGDKFGSEGAVVFGKGGGVISARIAMAAASGIVLTCDRSMLVEFGGYVELNRHWAYSLLHQMNFVQRKATTAKSKYAIADFDCVKRESVVATVEMEEIPPELILNWDQTGIRIVPSNNWTMDQHDVKIYVKISRTTVCKLVHYSVHAYSKRVTYVNHAVLSNLLSNDGNQLHVEIHCLTDVGDEIYLVFVA